MKLKSRVVCVLTNPVGFLCVWMCMAGGVRGGEGNAGTVLSTLEIREPLGQGWPGHWFRHSFTIPEEGDPVRAEELVVRDAEGRSLPAGFLDADLGSGPFAPGAAVRADFQASITRGETHRFEVARAPRAERLWEELTVEEDDGRITVRNRFYEYVFAAGDPALVTELRQRGETLNLARFEWPAGAVPEVEAQSVVFANAGQAHLLRTYRFGEDRWTVAFLFRAEDPWVSVSDSAPRRENGGVLTWDLRPLEPERVEHGGQRSWLSTLEMPGAGSTLETAFYPIVTLAPLAPPGWTNTSPYAYVASGLSDTGVGIAAVRAGDWRGGERAEHPWRGGDYREERHRRPESLLLRVRGDQEEPGQVRIEIPPGEGRREWALIVGPHAIAGRIPGMIRNLADLPLQRTLDEWILEWDSEAPRESYGFAAQWLNGPYMRPLLGSSSYPRRLSRQLDTWLADGDRVLRSRDLAAMAYVFRDANYHPSPYHASGWYTGNPNGHLDMFNIPMRIGLLMPDHPHAERWVREGVEELERTLHDYMSFEGGAWTESLSYSTYYFHYVKLAAQLRDRGVLNPFAEWPRLKESAKYLAAMHTPVDPRYGVRRLMPLGDTAPGNFIEQLREVAEHYRGIDEEFAEQLARFPEPWEKALDISSRAFPGFGVMLRGHAYDSGHESFFTIKAGLARNHFAGDELAVTFASGSTPLLMGYASHYSPRTWSAAGNNRPHPEGLTPISLGEILGFETGRFADVAVAEERAGRFHTSPMAPHETLVPSWDYPEVHVGEEALWRFRRSAILVKHGDGNRELPDYVVLRDEIDSPGAPVWQNFHVLARSLERVDGRTFRFEGQLGMDLTLHVLGPDILEVEDREWGWRGNSHERRGTNFEAYEEKYFGAWIPEDFEPGTWGKGEKSGEMAKWLRLRGAAGRSDWTVVVMPHRRGETPPTVERLDETRVRVSRGETEDILYVGGDSGVSVARNGELEELISADRMKGWEKRKPGVSAYPDLMPWQY